MKSEDSTYLRYKHHLTGVSRSFAFCIDELQGDFRNQVALAYLLLRVLDTLEDSPWSTVDQKIHALNIFTQEISKEDPKEYSHEDKEATDVSKEWKDIQQVMQSLGISSAEKKLMQSSDLLFQDFKKLNPDSKDILRNTILTMSSGMADFNKTSPLLVKNIFELDRYCFFVAGIVGELLERLHRKGDEEVQNLHKAIHFGLFLQKVNILKDQLQDQELGRFFVFDRTVVLSSVGHHAQEAMKYIHSLDVKEKGFRLFCSWSLFLGLYTLWYSEQDFRRGLSSKVPRWRAKFLIILVRMIISSPILLQLAFRMIFKKVFKKVQIAEPPTDLKTPFQQSTLYRGRLKSSDWKRLGLE